MKRNIQSGIGGLGILGAALLVSGCASDGSSGHVSYGASASMYYGDPHWGYGPWYDDDVIVVPPPPPPASGLHPSHPIATPPPARPTQLPARPIPRPAPRAMPRRR